MKQKHDLMHVFVILENPLRPNLCLNSLNEHSHSTPKLQVSSYLEEYSCIGYINMIYQKMKIQNTAWWHHYTFWNIFFLKMDHKYVPCLKMSILLNNSEPHKIWYRISSMQRERERSCLPHRGWLMKRYGRHVAEGINEAVLLSFPDHAGNMEHE